MSCGPATAERRTTADQRGLQICRARLFVSFNRVNESSSHSDGHKGRNRGDEADKGTYDCPPTQTVGLGAAPIVAFTQ